MPIPTELAEETERPFRVLAVDDDQDERDLLRAILENSGYVVELAANGFEAGLLVGSFKPDAVVMDLMMPAMDGFSAIGALRRREETVDIPVIASGGAGTLDHLVDAVEQGGADAVLCASIFHYGHHTVREAKERMRDAGIPVRL